MNKKIKKLWCAALRSGEYVQGENALLRDDKFCCLGVLCDLYSKEKGVEWKPDINGINKLSIHGERLLLPSQVMEWAELTYDDPMAARYRLTEMNDREGLSFGEIADFIETDIE